MSTTTRQDDTVDSLCLRLYGRTAGVTEALLDANPQLRDAPCCLPAGLTVTLPTVPPQPVATVLNLWD